MPNLIPNRGIRIEDELYLKLVYIAKQEERSANKQIVLALKKFVAEYEARHGEIEVDVDALYE